MNAAAPLLTEDEGPLSPWWIRIVLMVMVMGFSGLIAITMLSYRNAPPIPAQVVDEQGASVFDGDEIGAGLFDQRCAQALHQHRHDPDRR